MERLTKRNENGVTVLNSKCPEGCEYSTCSMEEGYQCQHQCEGNIIEKLAQYEELEEQGLLLRLPCKVGDTVYYISEGFIEPCTVEAIFLADYTDKDGNCSYMAEIHFDREDCPYVSTEIYFTDIGKTVFLTKAEAEKKLNEMSK